MRNFLLGAVLFLSSALVACSDDGGTTDSGGGDTSVGDTGGGDTGGGDTGGGDTGGGDTGGGDTGAGDTGTGDTGTGDASGDAAADTGPVGAGMCHSDTSLCTPTCFRPISCVKVCGGPATECGCCPCAPGDIDDFTCGDP